jgi:hypothetical protein
MADLYFELDNRTKIVFEIQFKHIRNPEFLDDKLFEML